MYRMQCTGCGTEVERHTRINDAKCETCRRETKSAHERAWYEKHRKNNKKWAAENKRRAKRWRMKNRSYISLYNKVVRPKHAIPPFERPGVISGM